MKRAGLILLTVLTVLTFAAPPAAFCGDKAVTMGTRAYYDIQDQDAMTADSATALATQQSIKAYVDNMTATGHIDFDLGAAAIDGANDADDASAPNLTTLDNVPALLWDDSGETAAAQWTFRVPGDYSTGMVFYALVSSNDASGSGTKLDWALTKNSDDTGFGSPTAQDVVECTSATLDASNEVLTLTPDATGAALFTAGAWITIEVFNASTNDDDLELKGLAGGYTRSK